jgi:hypothetical protein
MSSISLSDITLHPNGKMYGCSFSQRKFYEIDTTNGTTTELFTFPSGTRPVGMTAAANGKVYVSEGDGVPSRLFEVNVTNNTFVVKGLLANGSAGDLTWSNGEMYNVSEDNKLVKINIETPENSIVIGEFNTNTSDIFFFSDQCLLMRFICNLWYYRRQTIFHHRSFECEYHRTLRGFRR